jgi:hypothetical protein
MLRNPYRMHRAGNVVLVCATRHSNYETAQPHFRLGDTRACRMGLTRQANSQNRNLVRRAGKRQCSQLFR